MKTLSLPSKWLTALCVFLAGLAVSLPATANGGVDAEKPAFDTIPASDSPILQFRSVGLGIAPAHMLELDFYLASKWAIGANLFGESHYCDVQPCRTTTGLSAHVERFFLGNRWAHLGVRLGAYVSTYKVQQRNVFDGSEVARNGGIFGPKFGLTATFTPTRWTGLTVAATAMPAFFEGFKHDEWVERNYFVEWDGRPTREFLMTGMITVGMRFGVLDGPDRICRCCRDASIPCTE